MNSNVIVFLYKNIRRIFCYKIVIRYKLIISGMIFIRLSSINISCIFATNTWLIKNKFTRYIIIYVNDYYKLEGGDRWPIFLLPQNYLVINSSVFINRISNLRYNNFKWSLYQCIFVPSCCYPRRSLHDAKWIQTNWTSQNLWKIPNLWCIFLHQSLEK